MMAAAMAVSGLVCIPVWAADAANPPPAQNQAENQLNRAGQDAKNATNNAGAAVNNGANAAGDKAQSTGDKIRNSVDQAGAGNPTAANPAPDADGIRKTIAAATNDALTKGDMNRLIGQFVDADRNRIDKSADKNDPNNKNYGEKLDGRIQQIQKAWKDKYGHDFDIDKQNEVFSDQFASIQQGKVGDENDAQLASEVMKNSEDQATGNNANAAGNTKGDENLEKGRGIAVMDVKGTNGMPDLKVPMIHELPDSWKINVPDSVDSTKLRQNLLDHLTAVGEMSAQWPTDEKEAYRVVAHHVLMAVLDQPMPQAGQGGAAPTNEMPNPQK
jgi:hypothetical protein